jgi:hypothetical protein
VKGPRVLAGLAAAGLAGAAGCNLLIGLQHGLPEGSGGAGATSTGSGGASGASTSSASSGGACVPPDAGTGQICDRTWAQWKPKPSSFHDNGDLTVTDATTGLTWQKSYATGKTWQDAKAYCAGLPLAGHCDWRLPTRIELSTLVDDTAKTAPLVSAVFDAEPNVYWTASPLFGSAGASAWAINFQNGLDMPKSAVTSSFDVRCVR